MTVTTRLDAAVVELVDALRAELRIAVLEPGAPPALLDVPSAARAIGVSRTTLYELMDRGELRSVRAGRRRLIPRSAVVDFARGTAPANGASAPGAVD